MSLVIKSPKHATTITAIGAGGGGGGGSLASVGTTGNVTMSTGTNTIHYNGSIITSSPYVSNNTVYVTGPGSYVNINMEPWTYVEYESLAPMAIKEQRTGKRLVIWEP